jgi:hypothetical protein
MQDLMDSSVWCSAQKAKGYVRKLVHYVLETNPRERVNHFNFGVGCTPSTSARGENGNCVI